MQIKERRRVPEQELKKEFCKRFDTVRTYKRERLFKYISGRHVTRIYAQTNP
jgi:hypothetical protein